MDTNSSSEKVMQLFPRPGGPVALRGLYLEEFFRPRGTPDKPFVYANFITSLDGRISLPDPQTKTLKVPQEIANPRDWRLFQELTASADVLVTTGRYIRDLASGTAQNRLPVSSNPKFADLLEWRRANNLTPQPAVAIVSNTLNLPIPDALLKSDRSIYVITGAATDASHIEALLSQGVHLLRAGKGNRVEGLALIEELSNEGFGNIDMIAGSVLLRTLLADGALDRLYLTQACRLLGGSSFDTLLKGQQLAPPGDFKLRSLFYDAGGDNNIEQLFTSFDHRQ